MKGDVVHVRDSQLGRARGVRRGCSRAKEEGTDGFVQNWDEIRTELIFYERRKRAREGARSDEQEVVSNSGERYVRGARGRRSVATTAD